MNENVINLFVDATSFTRLRKAMLILAIRMLGNFYDAEDVVQDACVKLWQKCEVYRNNLLQEALCAKVVRNLCIDRLRITQLNDADEKALSSIACESIESEVECNDIKSNRTVSLQHCHNSIVKYSECVLKATLLKIYQKLQGLKMAMSGV